MDQSSAGRNNPRAQTLMDKAYVDTVRLMLDVAPDVLAGVRGFHAPTISKRLHCWARQSVSAWGRPF